MLCQVHLLGERLLMHESFFEDVRDKLKEYIKAAIEEVNEYGTSMSWMAEIIHQVLSESAPCGELSLRRYLLYNLYDFTFCTTFNFLDCASSFELDGGFAADLMMYLARELKWAVELWGAQTQSTVDVAEKKLREAEDNGELHAIAKRPKGKEGIWLALRHLCTYTGCTTTDFRAYSRCFELDGSFAAEILDFMGAELKWVVERWGQERGPEVDVAQEREDEGRIADDYHNIGRLDWRNMYRW